MTAMNQTAPDPLEVGARVRALRHESDLSQSGLAKIIGVSPGAVGNWEQGQGCPTIRQAFKMCEKFNVTLDYIFRGRINDLTNGRATKLSEFEDLKHDPTGPNLGTYRR